MTIKDESSAIEVSRLLDKVRELNKEERETLNYFLENISVGSIRAVKELKLSGKVRDPISAIRKLVAMGFLEDAGECYNLAKPLR
ncbi:MAG: hypothetical protein QW065_03465, partial [Acidilobaceae archaeon]